MRCQLAAPNAALPKFAPDGEPSVGTPPPLDSRRRFVSYHVNWPSPCRRYFGQPRTSCVTGARWLTLAFWLRLAQETISTSFQSFRKLLFWVDPLLCLRTQSGGANIRNQTGIPAADSPCSSQSRGRQGRWDPEKPRHRYAARPALMEGRGRIVPRRRRLADRYLSARRMARARFSVIVAAQSRHRVRLSASRSAAGRGREYPTTQSVSSDGCKNARDFGRGGSSNRPESSEFSVLDGAGQGES
jgi:hypothetical protein